MLTIHRDDCVNNCDQKAECNAGWPDSKWSTAETCPLNVCCSKFGFCGTTKEFCGEDNGVKRPSCDIGSTQIKRVIGYYEGWSLTERSCYSMIPEKIPYGVYTHLNFAFATIDPATFKIKPGDSNTEYLMQRISSIKLIQPDIKIWIAVGGWAFNDPGPTASIFSDLSASESKQEVFFDSLVKMMNTFGFDGIDVDWEYPVDKDRGGRHEDFKNFVSFIKNLKNRMSADGQKRGVSLTLPSSYWYLKHFDIVNLEKHVDWFNLMSYDIHGAWDIGQKWTGSFLNSHTNMTEIQDALDLLWRNNINPDKVVLGMAFYSRSFTMESTSCTEPKCGALSGGIAGKCSHTTGVLLNPEIQDIIKEKGLTPKLHRNEAVKVVSWDNQWASFDDEVTWRIKLNVARSQCISNIMVWAISQDDDKDTNAKALVKAAGREIRAWPDFTAQPSKEPPVKATVVKLCRWTNCSEDCHKGFKSVPRDGTDLLMTHTIGCDIYPGHGTSRGWQSVFCCPGDLEIPKCRWRGHRNSGACQPGCEKGEVEVGTLAEGCSSKHQSACCDESTAVAPFKDCKWHGSAPICAKSGQHADCSTEFPHFLFAASAGAGGEQTCSQGSKSYCCKEPPPDFATDCQWYKKATDHYGTPIICEPSCPEDQIRLAIHLGDCQVGMQAYCCKGKPLPKLEPRGNDDDIFAEGEIKEFRSLLKDYVKNPTCPAEMLHPSLHPIYEGSRKRSLVLEARESEILHGRAIDCTMDNWIKLVSYLALILSKNTPEMVPFRLVWSSEFIVHFDSILESSSLGQLLHSRHLDSRGLAERVLYDPQNTAAGIRRDRSIAEIICERTTQPTHLQKKAKPALEDSGLLEGKAKNSTLEGRRIVVWPTRHTNPGTPTINTVLNGVNSGRLTLHYARWEWAEGTQSNAPAGPFLELAYWIGRTPGVQDSNSELNRYRDLERALGDDWVIFHLHMDPESEILRNVGGRTYIGITYITVFHSQDYRGHERGWRVQVTQTGYENERDGFDCPQDEYSSAWYIGTVHDASQLSPEDQAFYMELDTWGRRLFNDGYTGRLGTSAIIQGGGTLANGDIDPNNYGYIVRRNGMSAVLNNRDPYGVNFLLRNGEFIMGYPPPEHDEL
ncbi:putative chitinase [Microsporum ferrugineum]